MKKKNRIPKICLVSSSGGHFEQLLMLYKLKEEYNVFIITEKTKYNYQDERIKYFLPQTNRKEQLFILKIITNFFKSLYILFREKPNVIISTGALSSIPTIYLGHIFKKKVIFIESFAKIYSPSMTGEFVYRKKLANQFYVQWESLLKYYPSAIYKGGIY